MTRVIREGKRRRTPLLAMALLGVVLGVLIGGGGFGAAASGTGASVSDYSQCANGAKNATPTNDPTICNKGMIFGILNANNSQYGEDQVTFQRLILTLPKGGSTSGRTIVLKYLVRKGTHHAYDSLATWDDTIAGTLSNACASLNTPNTTTCTSLFNAGATVKGIPDDPSVVSPDTNGGGGVTTVHMEPAGVQRQLEMYGLGAGGSIDTPTYGGVVDESGDLYETINITYSLDSGVFGGTLASNTTVMLLFGGHLAAGGTTAAGSAHGWGGTNGASDISGGPYHIKLINLDSASIGNRDNQITAGAISPFFSPSGSTSPGGSATFSATLTDSLSLTGTNGSPTGNVTFTLYGDGTGVCTTAIFSKVVSISSSGAASTSDTAVGTPTGSNVVTTAGVYEWTVHYDGDGSNAAFDSTCGHETDTVVAPTVTGTTTP
jgi:hypothetical protein